MGYGDLKYAILNTKDYGIPQNRERLWMFARLGGLPDNFSMTPPTIENGLKLKDFVDDNPEDFLYLSQKQIQSNIYYDNEDIYSNDTFIKQMKKQLGLGENACWFVSDINIRNQNELILTATIVNATENVEYDDTKALHMAWGKLNPLCIFYR